MCENGYSESNASDEVLNVKKPKWTGHESQSDEERKLEEFQ